MLRSDLTLAQFRTLKGKMESADPEAADAAGFLGGVRAGARSIRCAWQLLTLAESMRLTGGSVSEHTPELKAGDPERIKRVFGSQAAYAQKLIDAYKVAGVDPRDVFPQSFNSRTSATGSRTSRLLAGRPSISMTSIPRRTARA